MTIITRILLSSTYTWFNVIRQVATAIFYFDRSDSLQAIWPAAGQIVNAKIFPQNVKNTLLVLTHEQTFIDAVGLL